jgi:hypothetical protein
MEEARKPVEKEKAPSVPLEASRILSKPITTSWRGRAFRALDISDVVIPILLLILLAYGRRYVPGLDGFNHWLDRYTGVNRTTVPFQTPELTYEASPRSNPTSEYKREEQNTQTEDRNKAAGTEVTLSVEITESGDPLNATVIRSVNAALDKQAIGEAMKRHYAPVLRHGRPVRSLIQITVPVQK